MTISLICINLKDNSRHQLGIARSVNEASRLLMKAAKQDAQARGYSSNVIEEREGYCVVDKDERVSLYTFDDIPL